MKRHAVFTGAMHTKSLPFGGKERKVPSLYTVFKWKKANKGQATDGCKVSNKTSCKHKHRSWVAVLGFV